MDHLEPCSPSALQGGFSPWPSHCVLLFSFGMRFRQWLWFLASCLPSSFVCKKPRHLVSKSSSSYRSYSQLRAIHLKGKQGLGRGVGGCGGVGRVVRIRKQRGRKGWLAFRPLDPGQSTATRVVKCPFPGLYPWP